MNANATATATTTTTTTSTATPVVAFETMAILRGKGVTALQKVEQHRRNGAWDAALLGAGVGVKLALAAIGAEGFEATAKALAAGDVRPAYAVIVALHGKATSVYSENGKFPFSEWVRLGVALAAEPQATAAGKPTAAAKALALHARYSERSAAIRAEREAAISAAKALTLAGLTPAPV